MAAKTTTASGEAVPGAGRGKDVTDESLPRAVVMNNWLLGICAALLLSGVGAAAAAIAKISTVEGALQPMIEAIRSNADRISAIDREQRERGPRVYGHEILLKEMSKKIDDIEDRSAERHKEQQALLEKVYDRLSRLESMDARVKALEVHIVGKPK